MKRYIWLLLFATWLGVGAHAADPLELKDGDRVLLIGDTLIEREQAFGYWEAAITARYPDRNIVFRNLGWSADTPTGRSRVSFDWHKNENEWVASLRKQIEAVRPNVALIGYGMANSFDGESGLAKFKVDLENLVNIIKEVSGGNVRLVFLSPVKHESMPAPLPNPDVHNRNLELYASAIEEISKKFGGWYVPLYSGLSTRYGQGQLLTDNGVHLNESGYLKSVEILESSLGWKPIGVESLSKTPAFQRLRQTVIKKNELFFHRWRPQNQTYLFGFRKHEQGQNAIEVPKFDPLVEEQERRIGVLRKLGESPQELPSTTVLKGPIVPFTPQPKPEFDLAPGLEINLYAENPHLAKPIQMNFDAQGRLWVASSSVYPQIMPGQEAADKILVLEDKNGDGVAESSTVFVDGLLIPTGVEPGDGGVYVGQSTELLHFKDTDGDGKADQKRVVLSGFGTEDTHHILHTLRWGHDGHLYMNQSIYIHTHAETPHGVVRLNSGGILRLKTDTMEMGIHMKGLVNTWGHHIDRFGQSFATDGAGGEGINYVVPGAMYFTYAGARRILGSVSPGNYPKFCGLEILASEHFPDDWQGSMVTCDFRAHRVVRFGINDKDSAYITSEMPDLVRTTNVTFRPIDVKFGPDGALYIADWSNPIIQHGEVDFRDPRRDREHGRIWRVTHKGRGLASRPEIERAPTGKLLDLLNSRSGFNQQHARRTLKERGSSILPELETWRSKRNDDPALLEVLWLKQALGQVDQSLLTRILTSSDGRVRAAGVRVLSFWHEKVSDGLKLLIGLSSDPHPRVRLEAVRALSQIPLASAAAAVLEVAEKPLDTHLEYALWLSINDLSRPWIDSIKSNEWDFSTKPKQLEFGLKSILPAQSAEVLGLILSRHPLTKDGQGSWIELIGSAGTPKELQLLYTKLLAHEFDNPAAIRAFAALSNAARSRNLKPTESPNKIGELFTHSDPSLAAGAIRLAGSWKNPELAKTLVAVAGKNSNLPAMRLAALEALRESGRSELAQPLTEFILPSESVAFRRALAVTLAVLDLKVTVAKVIGILGEPADEMDKELLATWRSVLGIKGAAALFARHIPNSGFPPSSAKAGLRAIRESGRSEPEFVLSLTRGAGLEGAEVDLTNEELRQIAIDSSAKGDPRRGELIYRRAQLGCMSCHAIGGVGGKVGPDLTSIGASAPMDYLVESMFYPNRKIKEGYHALLLETSDGEELSGNLIRETASELVLRDVTDREVAVSKAKIKHRGAANSLMPAGLADALTNDERMDLFRFLSELGKPGEFDASRGNIARAWKLRPAFHTTAQFGEEKLIAEGFQAKEWQPVTTLVNGDLNLEILKGGLAAGRWMGVVGLFAGGAFQTASTGPVELEIMGAETSPIWVDGKQVANGPKVTLNLTAGKHTFVLRLDPKRLPEHLRVRSNSATFVAP